MSIAPLTSDQTDALQEIVNIAMGQAGDRLARTLDVFVELSVPRIRLVHVSEIVKTVYSMVDDREVVTAVRQSFYDNLSGEAIVLFGSSGCLDLAVLMGYASELSASGEQELLLDVGNVLMGACIGGIGAQFEVDLSFSPPSIMAERAALETVLVPENLPWEYSLLVEVNFGLENSDFKSHLLILMAEEGIESLRQSLERFMAAL